MLSPRHAPATAVVIIAGAWTLPLLSGCGPKAIEGGFHSDNPAAKVYAIGHAADARDPAAVPDLVELLDSDDPALRMFAIQALERITGTRLGYNPYVSAVERRPAVERWVARGSAASTSDAATTTPAPRPAEPETTKRGRS